MIPEIRFGICQVCGADGRDQTEDLTGADAAARSATGNGVVLEKFEGILMCPVCIADRKNDRESILSAKKHAEAEKFRAKAGFVNTVD